jgi:hypothetical protein
MDKIILHILDYFHYVSYRTHFVQCVCLIIPRWRFYNLITLSLTAFRGSFLEFGMALVIVPLQIGIENT